MAKLLILVLICFFFAGISCRKTAENSKAITGTWIFQEQNRTVWRSSAFDFSLAQPVSFASFGFTVYDSFKLVLQSNGFFIFTFPDHFPHWTTSTGNYSTIADSILIIKGDTTLLNFSYQITSGYDYNQIWPHIPTYPHDDTIFYKKTSANILTLRQTWSSIYSFDQFPNDSVGFFETLSRFQKM